jgi:hypothetical protein
VQYALQSLRIDAHMVQATPEAQQIVIANMDAVKPWLFG